MDAYDIEQAIEEELEKLSENLSDMDDEDDEDDMEIDYSFTATSEKPANSLPDSVLMYFEASRHRVNTFEQLILEDFEEHDTVSDELPRPIHCEDLLKELGSDLDEDPIKLKERIISEIEEQMCNLTEADDPRGEDETEHDAYWESEKQLVLKWRELEEKLRSEEEQRLIKQEAETALQMNSAREQEEKRRQTREKFAEELKRMEQTSLFGHLKSVNEDENMKESLELEMFKQQELIQRLEEQMEKERQVFEEAQQEQKRRTEERCCGAATKLQAAFRGALVRRWSKNEIIKRREEKKEREKRRKVEERMTREREEERQRAMEEEQRLKEEVERRRVECEHKLEVKRKNKEQTWIEEEKSKVEEEKMSPNEERKETEKENQKRMETFSVKEEICRLEEEEPKSEEVAKRIQVELRREAEEDNLKSIQEMNLLRKKMKVKEEEEKEMTGNEKTRKTQEKKMVEGKINKRIEEEQKKQKAKEETKLTEDKKRRKEDEKQRMDKKGVEKEWKVEQEEEEANWFHNDKRQKEEKDNWKMVQEKNLMEESTRKEKNKKIENEKTRKEDEIKQKRLQDKKLDEENMSVWEEDKRIKEEEEAKWSEDDRKSKGEEIQKTGKGAQEAKRIQEKQRRKKEEDNWKSIQVKNMVEDKKKVEKEVRTENESTRMEKKKQKVGDQYEVEQDKRRAEEEECKKKVEEETKRFEFEEKRKEKGEKEKIKVVEDAKRVDERKWNVVEEKQKRLYKMTEEEEKSQSNEQETMSSGNTKRKQVKEENQKNMQETKPVEEKMREVEEEKEDKRKEDKKEAKRIEDERKGEEEKENQNVIQNKQMEKKQQIIQEKKLVQRNIRVEEKIKTEVKDVAEMTDDKMNRKLEEKNQKTQLKSEDTAELIRKTKVYDEQEAKRASSDSPSLILEDTEGLSELREHTEEGTRKRSVARPSQSNSKNHLCKPLSFKEQEDQLNPYISPISTADSNKALTLTYQEKCDPDTSWPQPDSADPYVQCSSSLCLPDSTEQKRLSWIMNCTPWSKLSMQNKRKGLNVLPRKRGRRKMAADLPPLSVDSVLKPGPWSSFREVTSVFLEDLSGCSLSTLSECTRLQSLTIRRSGLQALDGLQQCGELRHVDLQENCITYVDCEGLDRLEVLLLGKNQLTNIDGLDGAVNLTVLQLSHNNISHISGLGTLKTLHRLAVDHNQLISTRGLSEVFTLLYLDCSYNHLSHVEGLENCALLNTLDLKGNSLTELPVLKNHVLLRDLCLDDNSISSLDCLELCWLPLVRCLSAAQNSVTKLPVLSDLLSLKTLDVSHNCLSELRNVCTSLSGCSRLQNLNLTDTPLQQENNWRSAILAATPNLIRLNEEQTGASGAVSTNSAQLWSVYAFCQDHQDQLDSLLQRHSREISSAPSVLDAQLMVSNHIAELFQLAEEQRYAHEYGGSSTSESAACDPLVSSCLQDLSDWKLAEKQSSQPEENNHQSWQEPHLPFQRQLEPPPQEKPTGYSESCKDPPRIDLKTVAALVIQCHWRKHRQKRTAFLGPSAKADGCLSSQSVASSNKRPEILNQDDAATIIQAVWRGYMLRKRLTRALMLARISDGDEAFEEVDMDEFVFDEEELESDWRAPHSDPSSSSKLPYSEQLLLPKPLPPLPGLHKTAVIQSLGPRQAWISSEVAVVSERSLSPDPNTSTPTPASVLEPCTLSERSEKILEEWGFSSGSTALLMLKRAQKMKARKQQHERKLLDPAVRLALFRNRNKRGTALAQRRIRPECSEEIKDDRRYLHNQDTLNGEPNKAQMLHRTYPGHQTQARETQRSSAIPASAHFLPEINPDILNGGRVQLMACALHKEHTDSTERSWTNGSTSSTLHTHSAGYAKKEALSPQRVAMSPCRKERISFRDNPVQLSGGWGGGKKRAKGNKFK